MRIGIISGVIGLFITLSVHAQKSDSIKSMLLPDVVVTETYQQRQAKKSALTVDVARSGFSAQTFYRKLHASDGEHSRSASNGYRFGILQTDDSRNGIQPDCRIGKRNQAGRTTMGSRSRFGTGCLQHRNSQCFERSLLIALW